MLKHVAIVAAIGVALGFFCWVGAQTTRLDVDRSPEKQFLQKIPETFEDKSGHYVTPILWPYDFIVMLLIAGATAWAGVTWGPMAFAGWQPWHFAVLPLAYLAFDLIEDSLLIMMLSGRMTITTVSAEVLRVFTTGKMLAFGGSIALTVLVGALAAWKAFR